MIAARRFAPIDWRTTQDRIAQPPLNEYFPILPAASRLELWSSRTTTPVHVVSIDAALVGAAMLGLVLTRMPRSARDETYAGTLAALVLEDFVLRKDQMSQAVTASEREKYLAQFDLD